MVISTVVVIIFAVFGQLQIFSCCDRAQNARCFDGAVFFRRNSALKTDIIRKLRTLGEMKCSQVCLSDNNCVAQTYCNACSSRDKGICYLHKNGIREEQISVLVRVDECTYQQYMNFYVSTLDIFFVVSLAVFCVRALSVLANFNLLYSYSHSFTFRDKIVITPSSVNPLLSCRLEVLSFLFIWFSRKYRVKLILSYTTA